MQNKSLIALALLLLLPALSLAAVSFDAQNSGANTTTFVIGFPLTVTSTANRVAVCMATVRNDAGGVNRVTAMTFGGSNMTFVASSSNSANGVPRGEIDAYKLLNPTSGLNNATATFSNNNDKSFECTTWSNALDLFGVATSSSDTALPSSTANPSSSVPTNAGQGLMDDLVNGSSVTSPNSPQVQIYSQNTFPILSFGGSYSTSTNAVSTNMGWTQANNSSWSYLAVSIKGLAAAASGPIRRINHGVIRPSR